MKRKPVKRRYILGEGLFKTQPGIFGFGIVITTSDGKTLNFKGIKSKKMYRLVMEEI